MDDLQTRTARAAKDIEVILKREQLGLAAVPQIQLVDQYKSPIITAEDMLKADPKRK